MDRSNSNNLLNNAGLWNCGIIVYLITSVNISACLHCCWLHSSYVPGCDWWIANRWKS